MNINEDLLQFYVYKKLIKKKDVEEILTESERLNTPAREYLLLKEITTEATEPEAAGGIFPVAHIFRRVFRKGHGAG